MHLSADSGEAFSIPPELAGPLPRRTCMRSPGVVRLVLASIAFAFAAGMLTWAGLSDLRKMQQRTTLQLNGREAIARVTGVWTHLLSYSFTVDGASYAGKAELPDKEQLSVRPGNLISIRYLPYNPSISHPSAWEWTALSNLELFIFPVIPGSFGLLIVLGLFKERQLLAMGTPAVGTITKCTSSRSHFELTYEFHSDDGKTLEAHDSYESRLAVGARVCVLYLPENPLRNGIYRGSSYRVRFDSE